MKTHPYAEIYPSMAKEEFKLLLKSIQKHGLREPVTVTSDDILLDGRHRRDACERAGVELRTRVFEGDDAAIWAFIKDANYNRRHLNAKQRARIANAEADLPDGIRSDRVGASGDAPKSQAQAAKDHGVGRASVQRARKIEQKGSPALKQIVFNSDKLSLEDGAKLADLDHETQTPVAMARNPTKKLEEIKGKRKKSEPAKEKTLSDPAPVYKTLINAWTKSPHAVKQKFITDVIDPYKAML
ncbi:MAG: ParB/RepB/Spo0J family partition protein [Geminicoccaceae bacterium]